MNEMIMKREFASINGTLYEILRTIRESHAPVVDVWREHLMADKVFKREGIYIFCRTVEDAQIVEEPENETKTLEQ